MIERSFLSILTGFLIANPEAFAAGICINVRINLYWSIIKGVGHPMLNISIDNELCRENVQMMKYTEEERLNFIEQLKNSWGYNPMFYLKFCSIEKYAKDVCEGKLYANTPEYFRRLEIEAKGRGQGDAHELISSMKVQDIVLSDSKTDEVLIYGVEGTIDIRFKDDDDIPIVSMVGIPLEDMIIDNVDENQADFRFPFTDEEFAKMEEEFGNYVVFINAKEIEQHVKAYCYNYGCDYILDKVEYCEQNRIDRMQSFNSRSKKRFLYKDLYFAYQREYRLALAREMPKDHYITIGALTNATYMKANQLKDLAFSLRYTQCKAI